MERWGKGESHPARSFSVAKIRRWRSFLSRQLIMNNDLYLCGCVEARCEIKTDRRRGGGGGREADRGVNNGRVL